MKSEKPESTGSPHVGLFDVRRLHCSRRSDQLWRAGSQFSDVNAFLTLAATRHTFLAEDLRDHPRIDQIVTAARAGSVQISLVSSKLTSRLIYHIGYVTVKPCRLVGEESSSYFAL